MTAEPGELYELHLENPAIDDLVSPVLIIALDGYIDAGSGVRLAVEHLLGSLTHTVVATFDIDQLVDYRSRRPTLTYQANAFTDYQQPELVVRAVTDTAGTSFLVLSGPEPDSQWERFIAAVGEVADRFAARLTVGLMAIPMGVPHTRPTGMSSHATRPGLLPEQQDWLGTGMIQVPGHAVGLLEYRFGKSGRDCIGFAAHVPHYIARSEYPETARTLVQATADATGLLLPTSGLDEVGRDRPRAAGPAGRGEHRGRRGGHRAGGAVRRVRVGHRPRVARPGGAPADGGRAGRAVRGVPGRSRAPGQLTGTGTAVVSDARPTARRGREDGGVCRPRFRHDPPISRPGTTDRSGA